LARGSSNTIQEVSIQRHIAPLSADTLHYFNRHWGAYGNGPEGPTVKQINGVKNDKRSVSKTDLYFATFFLYY
jgi:hypothetical protein